MLIANLLLTSLPCLDSIVENDHDTIDGWVKASVSRYRDRTTRNQPIEESQHSTDFNNGMDEEAD